MVSLPKRLTFDRMMTLIMADIARTARDNVMLLASDVVTSEHNSYRHRTTPCFNAQPLRLPRLPLYAP